MFPKSHHKLDTHRGWNHADGERRQTMGKLWGLLRSMVSGMPGPSAAPAARTQALVQGARVYLAQGHADYLASIVKGNRAQARSSLLVLTCCLSCYGPYSHESHCQHMDTLEGPLLCENIRSLTCITLVVLLRRGNIAGQPWRLAHAAGLDKGFPARQGEGQRPSGL